MVAKITACAVYPAMLPRLALTNLSVCEELKTEGQVLRRCYAIITTALPQFYVVLIFYISFTSYDVKPA